MAGYSSILTPCYLYFCTLEFSPGCPRLVPGAGIVRFGLSLCLTATFACEHGRMPRGLELSVTQAVSDRSVRIGWQG